jgi:hypothetical protein
MGEGKDVFTVLALKGNGNPVQDNECLLQDGSSRWPDDVMRSLTKCAIRMPRAVRMGVRKLGRGAQQQKHREEGDEQNTSPGVRCSNLGAP